MVNELNLPSKGLVETCLHPKDEEERIIAYQKLNEGLERLYQESASESYHARWGMVAGWYYADLTHLWDELGKGSIYEYIRECLLLHGGAWGWRAGRPHIPDDSTIDNWMDTFSYWYFERGLTLHEMAQMGYTRLLAAKPYYKKLASVENPNQRLVGILDEILLEREEDGTFAIPDEAIPSAITTRLSDPENAEALDVLGAQKSFLAKALKHNIERETGLPSLDLDTLKETSIFKPRYVYDAQRGTISAWYWNPETRRVDVATLFYREGNGTLRQGLIEGLIVKVSNAGIPINVVTGDDVADKLHEFLWAIEAQLG